MVFANLRREERIGLGIALGLHVALAIALLTQPSERKFIQPAERMTVNLSTDVGLEATAPDPVPESRAAIAPTLAPEPAPPIEAVAQPAPPIEAVAQPAVRPVEPPRPVATTPPRPRPVPRATARPVPQPSTASREPRRRPDAPASRTQATPKPKPEGGSRVGADFLPGAGSSTTTSETRVPASQIGASAKASLFQSVARQLRPKWQPPSGPDVEEIVTKIRFRLAADGTLTGRPDVVRQTGINDTNRAQASRHAEQAIRAVQLASPFDLPEEYYDAWKVITVDFDWKLSQ